MSVTFPPSNVRITQPQKETSTPVGQQQPVPAAGIPQAPVSASEQLARLTDGFEQASTRLQDWAKYSAAGAQAPQGTPGVVQQTTDSNCGPAVAVMLAGSKGTGDAQRMAELESKFTDGGGTNAQQLAKMLAHEGVSVKQAGFKYDQFTLDDTLAKGGKIAAMVDSSRITSRGDTQETGSPHWVMIDGKDDQGRYLVKDPSNGSSYPVEFNDLFSSVDSAWFKHQGGGMLLIDGASNGKSEAALSQENAQKVVPLADTDGGGSNARRTFGRESS